MYLKSESGASAISQGNRFMERKEGCRNRVVGKSIRNLSGLRLSTAEMNLNQTYINFKNMLA